MKIRLVPLALLAGLATFLASGAVALGSSAAASETIGLDHLDASFSPTALARGIATFDAVPTAANVAALPRPTRWAQPFRGRRASPAKASRSPSSTPVVMPRMPTWPTTSSTT